MSKEDKIAIKVENVSKTFTVPTERRDSLKSYFLDPFRQMEKRRFEALKDISFEVKKGEFLGIIGRNGSGKSTLLKLIAGIYSPDKGNITVNGKIVPFLELGVGFSPELSGKENIFLNGSILGMSRKFLEKKFDEIVHFAELGEFIDMPLKNYSSGMQVRLAFSIAIQADADIYLMDEVLAVGDSNFQSRCLEIFNKHKSAGKTIVLVTHDTTMVERYCTRAILLRNGGISKIGKAQEVGNAYIYQNMSDEERRLFNEEKKKLKKTEGEQRQWKRIQAKKRKTAQITKVELLDEDGDIKSTFHTGDDISIRVCYKKHKPLNQLNIGIGIYKDDGSYVASYNTQMDQYDVDLESNSITLNLMGLPLLKGAYYINVVCFGEIEEKFFDFKNKTKSFKIYPTISTSRYRGIVNIPHEWK